MTDYETLQSRRNRIVGVFIIVSFLAFWWLVFKFGDLPTAVTKIRSFDVYVQFPSAAGVEKGTPVRFCGYQIGRVTRVDPPAPLPMITAEGPTGPVIHQVLVVLSIERRYSTIPVTSTIRLVTRGLGSSYIEIQASSVDVNQPVFLTDGSRAQGLVGTVSDILPEQAQAKLESLATEISALASSARAVIGDPNTQANLRQTIANIAAASRQLPATMDRVQLVLDQISQAARQYEALAADARQAMTNLDDRTDRLANSFVQASNHLAMAGQQLEQILAKVNQGQGSVGRLIVDPRLYEELLETTDQFQALADQVSSILTTLQQKGLRGLWGGSRRN